MQSGSLRVGDLVRLRLGGPLMIVDEIQGDNANCFWTDFLGNLNSERFLVSVLQGPITLAAADPKRGEGRLTI